MNLLSLAEALRDVRRVGSTDASLLAFQLKTTTAAISRTIREHGDELAGLVGVRRVVYEPGRYKKSTGASPASYRTASVSLDE